MQRILVMIEKKEMAYEWVYPTYTQLTSFLFQSSLLSHWTKNIFFVIKLPSCGAQWHLHLLFITTYLSNSCVIAFVISFLFHCFFPLSFAIIMRLSRVSIHSFMHVVIFLPQNLIYLCGGIIFYL